MSALLRRAAIAWLALYLVAGTAHADDTADDEGAAAAGESDLEVDEANSDTEADGEAARSQGPDGDSEAGEGVSADDAAGALVGTAAAAAPTATPDARLVISGYLSPQLGLTYRPDGLPRDRYEYGMTATRAGLQLGGDFGRWSYALHLVVEAKEGAGKAGDLSPVEPAVLVERAAIVFQPVPFIELSAGQMRVPFTFQEQSPATELLFPQRSGPNRVFVSGTDLGALAGIHLRGGRLSALAGAFNGTGRAIGPGRAKGLVWAARVDLNPLGAFPFGEADLSRRGLRVGIGAGLLYRATEEFDQAGYFGLRARDLRVSGSVRASGKGLQLAAEVLRRQLTDSLSSRPEVTTGVYGQGAYLLPLGFPVGFAPMGRVGWSEEDQGFAPRETLWLEVGLSIYPRLRAADPGALRLLVEYLGEQRLTEGEDAHGLVAQAQLEF